MVIRLASEVKRNKKEIFVIRQIDWTTAFKDNSNPDCEEVDFMVMMHPRNKPSKYKISDFALKGQRTTTLHIEKDQDYVFQVIFREYLCLLAHCTMYLAPIGRNDYKKYTGTYTYWGHHCPVDLSAHSILQT